MTDQNPHTKQQPGRALQITAPGVKSSIEVPENATLNTGDLVGGRFVIVRFLGSSGGGVFDTAVRRGVESPWERIRALRWGDSARVLRHRIRIPVGMPPRASTGITGEGVNADYADLAERSVCSSSASRHELENDGELLVSYASSRGRTSPSRRTPQSFIGPATQDRCASRSVELPRFGGHADHAAWRVARTSRSYASGLR